MPDQPTRDARKRIPNTLDTDPKLVGDYTLADLAVALGPAAGIILLTRLVLPDARLAGYTVQALAMPVAALSVAVGALFVSLTPAYTSSSTWAMTFGQHWWSAPDADHRDAGQYTQVERVHPERDAVERTDGALVGALRITPPTMALATEEDWATAADQFTDVLNTTVEFPVQLYATTRPFPVDDYLATFEERVTDPDVQANPTLERLIDGYVEWYRADLAQRQTTIRDHYAIVPVRPASVRHTDDGLAQRLADVPVVGIFVDVVTADRAAAERAAMADALDDRLRQLEQGFRDIDGCAAHRVSAAALTELVADYWTDQDRDEQATEATLRTTPLVGGPT